MRLICAAEKKYVFYLVTEKPTHPFCNTLGQSDSVFVYEKRNNIKAYSGINLIHGLTHCDTE